MFPFNGNFNPLKAPITSQVEMCNLAVMQGMQDYLRFLILNVNVAEFKLPNPAQTSMNTAPSSQGKVTETKTIGTELTADAAKKKKVSLKNQKSSARLWNLMVKKYSTKKIRAADKVIDPNERNDEGEIYRKYNGVYVPIIKHQTLTTKKEITCGHPDREHYARGLCGTCYHKVGRYKKPWNCAHEKLYALGLCHKCYSARNRQIKKQNRKNEIFAATNPLKDMLIDQDAQNIFDFKIKQEC